MLNTSFLNFYCTLPSLLVVNKCAHLLDKLFRNIIHAVVFLTVFGGLLQDLFLGFTTGHKIAVHPRVSARNYLHLYHLLYYLFIFQHSPDLFPKFGCINMAMAGYRMVHSKR